jgi:hypothetical protein
MGPFGDSRSFICKQVVWFGRVWEGQGWGPKEGVPERRKAAMDHGKRSEWMSGSLLGHLVQWAGQRGKIRFPVSKKPNEAQEGQNFLGIVRRREVLVHGNCF